MTKDIAEVLEAADLKPDDYMPVDTVPQTELPRVLDANELLWVARILNGLVRVLRDVVPEARERVRLAELIVDSYQGVPDIGR